MVRSYQPRVLSPFSTFPVTTLKTAGLVHLRNGSIATEPSKHNTTHPSLKTVLDLLAGGKLHFSFYLFIIEIPFASLLSPFHSQILSLLVVFTSNKLSLSILISSSLFE